MNVKKLIGSRIANARKLIGLSQIELSALSGFGKSRVSNWETGFRTPKLEEAKILEKILQVPASYLLCLSDIKEFPTDFGENKAIYKAVPIFNESDLLKIEQLIQLEMYNAENYLPIIPSNENLFGPGFFAFQLFDDSMSPDFGKNDLVVFNPYVKARHNDHVLVKTIKAKEILFRKHVIDNSNLGSPLIKLVPLNKDWVSTNITDLSQIIILGVMSSIQRIFT